ncbi:MAG: DUF4160 domain-containing protein [Phycisphaerae bacterium]
MFYYDHEPAHFHARYGSQKARFTIDDASMLDGDLGPRARALVVEWATQHRTELSRNWTRARQNQPLEAIAPLE